MMISKRGGYWVTDATEVLETFITQASERYTALEQALEPITATVVDLDRNWTPRWADYWHAKTKALASLRAATRTALQLFQREQSSQAAPVALVVVATSIAYTSSLRSIEVAIEEAGILITAHSAADRSLDEKHIRQRQRVLQALREVDQEVREAITVGRAELDQAPMLQVRLTYAPGETAATQHSLHETSSEGGE